MARVWIGAPEAVGAIRLYGSFVPVFCLCGVMTGYFTAANRIGTLAAVEIAEQLVSMGVTMSAMTLWAGTDPVRACQSVILGSGVSGCLTLSCLVLLRLRERGGSGNQSPVRKRLLATAVPLALADDLKAGINTAENLMVPKRLARYPGATDPLGALGTVCGMVFPVLMFPAAILFALAELPLSELARCAAAGSKARIAYLAKRGLKVALLYGCLFSGLEFLLARPLCLRLYGSEEAGNYLRMYALLIPMLYCDALTDAMTKGLGQQKACVRYNIITSAMDVAFLFILLPKYGMIGYFISFLVTHLLNFILSLRRLLKITGRVLSLRVILGAVGTLGAALWGASQLSGAGAVIAFVLLWGCLLALLGILGQEDLHWLGSVVRKK